MLDWNSNLHIHYKIILVTFKSGRFVIWQDFKSKTVCRKITDSRWCILLQKNQYQEQSSSADEIAIQTVFSLIFTLHFNLHFYYMKYIISVSILLFLFIISKILNSLSLRRKKTIRLSPRENIYFSGELNCRENTLLNSSWKR